MVTDSKSPRRREIRALAEPALHGRIARSAKAMRISMGNWLLLAAEAKLAREEQEKHRREMDRAGNGEGEDAA